MQKTWKRLSAMLLCAAILLSIMPTAYAEESTTVLEEPVVTEESAEAEVLSEAEEIMEDTILQETPVYEAEEPSAETPEEPVEESVDAEEEPAAEEKSVEEPVAEEESVAEEPAEAVLTESIEEEMAALAAEGLIPEVEITEMAPVVGAIANDGMTDYRKWAQGDSRWGSLYLGNSSDTVAKSGCLITAVTKIIIQAGIKNHTNYNVGTMVKWMNANGGFTDQGWMYWYLPASYAGMTYHGYLIGSGTHSSTEYNEYMLNLIRQGYHLILAVNGQGHWIAVDEAKSLATGVIHIMDSWSSGDNADITLASRYPTFNLAHGYTGGTTSKTCTLQFKPNGGTGTMSSQSVILGNAMRLPANRFTKAGCSFNGWTVKRSDNTWYVNGRGWLTGTEIAAGGYKKCVYSNGWSGLFDRSWTSGGSGYTYTFYAQWAKEINAPKIKISNDAATGKVKLTWNAVDGAVKYKVYRSKTKGGKFGLMKVVTDTSYINQTAEAGQVYYYYVVAVTAQGVVSARSNILYQTCDLAQPVVSLSSVASTGKIRVSWKAVEGAVKYRVYRCKTKNGTYGLMKTVTGTSMINRNAVAGTRYYYKVVAVAENEKANSAESAIRNRVCDLARPQVTVTLTKDGKPKLSWKAIDGAVKYQVYRCRVKNGEYVLMKGLTGTSCINYSAKSGMTYYYKVIALHKHETANSAYSIPVSVTTPK